MSYYRIIGILLTIAIINITDLAIFNDQCSPNNNEVQVSINNIHLFDAAYCAETNVKKQESTLGSIGDLFGGMILGPLKMGGLFAFGFFDDESKIQAMEFWDWIWGPSPTLAKVGFSIGLFIYSILIFAGGVFSSKNNN